MRLSSTARMLSMNTETSKPLEKFHIYSLHLRSTIAHCIYCAVYCQLKYSMKILKHLLSILKLYIILDISCKLLVYILYIYRVSQEERTKLREGVPYVKLYRYNPKHLHPKLNGYGDNGKRSLKL